MASETNIAPTAPPQRTYNGVFEHSLDDKRRLQVPSRWRPASGEMEWKALVWPKGPASYLVVLTLEDHAAVMARLSAAGMADEKALGLKRFFSRHSTDLVMDKAGRVVVPENIAKAVGIEKDAVLVGMHERFEIWAPQRFNQIAAMDDAVAAAELGKYL